jgi:hypothetical protein
VTATDTPYTIGPCGCCGCGCEACCAGVRRRYGGGDRVSGGGPAVPALRLPPRRVGRRRPGWGLCHARRRLPAGDLPDVYRIKGRSVRGRRVRPRRLVLSDDHTRLHPDRYARRTARRLGRVLGLCSDYAGVCRRRQPLAVRRSGCDGSERVVVRVGLADSPALRPGRPPRQAGRVVQDRIATNSTTRKATRLRKATAAEGLNGRSSPPSSQPIRPRP